MGGGNETVAVRGGSPIRSEFASCHYTTSAHDPTQSSRPAPRNGRKGANPAVRLRFGRWPGWLRNPKFDPID
jgi:hypothetical protein